MKNKICILIIFVALSIPSFSFSAQLLNPEKINTDISITSEGRVSIKNAKIMQFVGNTIYIRLLWEETFIRMTLKTGNNTTFTKKYGETTTVSEMKIGDRLDIDGILEPGPDSLTVVTTSIKNLSDERGQYKLSGVISGKTTTNKEFLMKANDGKIVTLSLEDSPKIIKGNKVINFSDIKIGDTVLNVEGVFNFGTGVFRVSKMNIYINLNLFKPRNFQGVLKKISGNVLPTVLTVTVDDKNYTVKVPADAIVMNRARAKTQFSRFVVGDDVRFWGSIPEGDDLYFVNAEIIRNLSL